MKNREEKDNMFSVMINICTRVVTLVFVIATILPFIFGNKNQRWTISDIWGVLFIGVFSGLMFGVFYALKKPSKLLTNIFFICYFFVINSLVLGLGFKLQWFSTELKSVLYMEGMFLLVFLLVYVLVYVFDFHETKKINQKLQDRKKLRRGEQK